MYILMKKVIILRKIHVTMCFQTFQFEPEQKICVVMRAMRKKRNIHTSAVDLLHIRIGNLGWCKCRHFKNEAREIDCLCCR